MGIKIGKILGKVATYAIPGYGQYKALKDIGGAEVKAGKWLGNQVGKGVNWLGSKPQGAQDLNNQLNQRLSGFEDPNDLLNQFVSTNSPTRDTRYDSLFGDLGNYTNDMRGRLGTIRDRSDKAYNDAYSGFQSFLTPLGGMDPNRVKTIDNNISQLGQISKYGAQNQNQANRVRGNGVFDQFANLGAGSTEERDRIRGNGVFDQISKLGAGSPEELARLRGNGTFDEFNQTGGLSDEDIANMRTRGNSTGSSIFAGLRRNMDTASAIRGRGPGFGASQAKLAREAARAADEADLNTELGITDEVNQGRQWGAENVANAEQGIQGNRLNAAGQLSGAERSLSANRLAGASGLSDAEKSLISNMIGANQAGSAQQMALLEAISGNKKYGNSGLASLYSTPGADLGYQNDVTQGYGQMGNILSQSSNAENQKTANYLRALGMRDDRITNILAILNGRNPNASNFDKYGNELINALITGGKAAAGAF